LLNGLKMDCCHIPHSSKTTT